MMDLDSQAQEVMEQLASYQAPAIETLSPEAARNVPLLDYAARDLVASKAGKRLLTLTHPMPERIARITHARCPGQGRDNLLRIYRPEGHGPLPVLVYFHGGGWVIGSPNHYDDSCRALANAAECVVVSVGYRLAPEHKYPAAVEDAFDATQWVMQNAGSFGGDIQRVAVGGESAGGNLATVVCLMARNQGAAMPVHQLLVYPVTNFGFDSDSYREHAHASPLNAAMMHWFWGHYLRTEAEGREQYASPLQARDLSGLPPTTLITAEFDPLRDDGRAYADRLETAGVPVHYLHYEGLMHEFFGLAGLVDQAQDAMNKAAADLKKSFHRDDDGGVLLPLDSPLEGMPA